MKRIELTYDETLEALGAALDLRDTETEGHSHRVSRYCMETARTLGCSGSSSTTSSADRIFTTSARSAFRTPSCSSRAS